MYEKEIKTNKIKIAIVLLINDLQIKFIYFYMHTSQPTVGMLVPSIYIKCININFLFLIVQRPYSVNIFAFFFGEFESIGIELSCPLC